jgi:hypothetical protein
MRKLFISLSALLFGTMMTQAQLVIKPAVGINFTDMSKDAESGEYKAKVGWQIGGSVVLGKRFYFEPGIFYVQKTSRFESTGTVDSNVNFNLSGIRVPLSIGFNLLGDEKSTFKLRAVGGGSAFILTGVKNLEKDDFKTTSWGLFAGAELQFSIIFLNATYEWSLTNISENVDNIDVGKTRSAFIQAGIHISL